MITEVLKNSILIEAFKGNLTERNKDDSSVDELLKTIEEEKQAIIIEKKIDKISQTISDKEIPFCIPQNWRWVRWGNLSYSIQYGVNAGAKNQGKIKMVRISDIQDNSIIWEDVPYCDISDNLLSKYVLNENDILFARTGGTVGKSVIVKDMPQDVPYVFAGYLIRSNYNKRINCKFLKFFMESPLYWNQLREKTIGSAQPNCNGQKLSNMILPLPPIEEQQRIVDKIEELFTKIDEIKPIEEEIYNLKNNFVIQIKRNILLDEIISIDKKIALENYMDTKLKEGWKWVKFSEVADCRMGKTILGKELTNCGIPVYSATNTNEVFGFVPDAELILNKGDIVIPARGNSIGYATFINDEVATCTQTTIACKPKKNIYNKYLYYCCYAFKNVWFKYTGSAIPQITISKINNNYVPLPPFEQQKKIVERLEKILPLCDEIEKLIKGN